MLEKVLWAMDVSLKAYDRLPGMEMIDDFATGVQCLVCRRGETLTIAFRGTDSAKDWRGNLSFGLKKTRDGFRVHRGFLRAYQAPQIRLRLRSLILPGIRRVVVCGHSLGAAMAVLCAMDLMEAFPVLSAEVYLFGCPRVGNHTFRDTYNRRVPCTIRVENGNDIVTKIPPAILGYRHVGSPLRVGKKRIWGLVSLREHSPERYCEAIIKKAEMLSGKTSLRKYRIQG